MREEIPKSIKCNIGGHHILDAEFGAISLVRRLGQEHSFIVLERFEEGGIRSKVAHLTYKPDTRETKAIIIYNHMSNAKLTELAAKCHSITWQISKAKMEAFEMLMQVEVARGEAGEIDYVMLGKTKVNNLIGASVDVSLPEASVESSKASVIEKRERLQEKIAGLSEETKGKFSKLIPMFEFFTISFFEMLLRNGDNCVTWSISVLESLGIYRTDESKFHPILFANPTAIVDGNLDGDEEPDHTTGCVMC